MEFKRLPDPRRRAETKRFFHEASLSYGTDKGGRKFWRTRKGKQASLAFWAVEEAYREHPSASKAFINETNKYPQKYFDRVNNIKYLIKLITIFTVLVFCTSKSLAEIYKWTDKNGVIHYSENKPEEIVVEELAGVNSHSYE